MARLEMLKAADRLVAAVKFSDYRLLLRKDAQGFDHAKSLRDVSPKNALETIIRHFMDTAEQKREARELTDAAAQQLRRAEDQSINARDFSVEVDRILADNCRGAGVSPRDVAPMLNSEQIVELKEFAEGMPFFSTMRKEFTEAARLAELSNHEREAAEAARESMGPRTHDPSVRPRDDPHQAQPSTERSDRDTSFRGR